jgi:4,5-dihydroxyphthalate decarboxylase
MHVVVVRGPVLERHPWVAANLVAAFSEARDRSVARLRNEMVSAVPLPWPSAAMKDATALLGQDVWPYGLEGNRTTLETFVRLAYEQGVAHRRLQAEELFAPESLSTHAV